jgi:hypothetical protein
MSLIKTPDFSKTSLKNRSPNIHLERVVDALLKSSFLKMLD